jgi:hypothetical protein
LPAWPVDCTGDVAEEPPMHKTLLLTVLALSAVSAPALAKPGPAPRATRSDGRMVALSPSHAQYLGAAKLQFVGQLSKGLSPTQQKILADRAAYEGSFKAPDVVYHTGRHGFLNVPTGADRAALVAAGAKTWGQLFDRAYYGEHLPDHVETAWRTQFPGK